MFRLTIVFSLLLLASCSTKVSNPKDVKVSDASLYFLPATMRTPLRFGNQTLTAITCARTAVKITDHNGKEVTGWGETPLSVGWVWPSKLSYDLREKTLKDFCALLANRLKDLNDSGHPFEISHRFITNELPELRKEFSKNLPEEFPELAALSCYASFDIAMHDAYGICHDVKVFETFNKDYMNYDLSHYLTADNDFNFHGKYPEDFFSKTTPSQLITWHLVGGLDPLNSSELKGTEPKDGYPNTLEEWITRDGLKCLKIKLKGNNAQWDIDRLKKIGEISKKMDVDWLTADFNGRVDSAEYVNGILDYFRDNHPEISGKILYIEQPFHHDLKKYPKDAHSCSSRKPLFMDESAHDWTYVRMGFHQGWNGVALKTCKTLTGALLSLAWAKAHGMTLMVQDLTNPMLAQIPHVLLAAHVGTIKGVECNSMQFYPEVSRPNMRIHPGLYQRRNGVIDLSTLKGPGFGYRLSEIGRTLPQAEVSFK
ncbi:MAG: hypothetical protein NE328_11380 [Lentisphaeraceae bacterium]|nr:hypothetical protein [Lentisphaeraceae bacterium]